MPDPQLERIRAGDETTLAEVLAREWGGLVRFLDARLGERDAAQDAAQEAFVRLWERRETWQAGSARALLYRIAVNVAADLERKARVRTRWGRRVAATGAVGPPTPAEHVEASEAEARFRAALRAMAPRRREVFRLVRYEALSYGEVAEALGVSVQTVANHMSLALRELRDALAEVLPVKRPDVRHGDDARSNDG